MQSLNSTISVSYSLKWQIKGYTHYKFTKCAILFNCKTGRIKKQCLNGGSIGYWIDRKFYTLPQLRSKLEKIPKDIYPF